MSTSKYRRKPIIVEAIQFTGANVEDIWEAFGTAGIYGPTEKNPDYLILTTIHGDEAPARAGDWIIPDGRPATFYPCNPHVFGKLYEPDATRSVTASGTEVTVDHIAKGLAFGIDDDEIIANGQPLFATDATVDGNIIRWDVDSGRDESFTVVLRVESVTTR